jgi:hypothetical protein
MPPLIAGVGQLQKKMSLVCLCITAWTGAKNTKTGSRCTDTYSSKGAGFPIPIPAKGRAMAIYKVDGGYVIASGGVWLPGCYEDERTARYAFRLPDAELVELRNNAIARGDGVITWGDVAKAAEAVRQDRGKAD